MLTITTVGTGTAFPEAERGPACMLVHNDARRIVIDLGSGSLQKLCRHGVTPLDMDALLLTHAHLDHLSDLMPLLFALHVPGYARPTPLPIYASAVTLALIDRLRSAYGGWIDVPEENVRFVELSKGQELEVEGVGVSVRPVRHTDSSLGYRLTGPSGEVLAVPGDTGPCAGLIELCAQANLAVIECSMPDAMPIDGHMNPSALKALVEASGLQKLAITHQYPAGIANDSVGTLRSLVSIDIVVPNDGDTLLVCGA